jgi:hypothetical protein
VDDDDDFTKKLLFSPSFSSFSFFALQKRGRLKVVGDI